MSQVQEACGTTGLSELLDAIRDKVKDETNAEVESETQAAAAEVTEAIAIHDSADREGNCHLVLENFVMERLTEDSAMKLSRFQQHAKRLVATYTKFEVEPETEQQLMLMLQKCFPGQRLLAKMCGVRLHASRQRLFSFGLFCGRAKQGDTLLAIRTSPVMSQRCFLNSTRAFNRTQTVKQTYALMR